MSAQLSSEQFCFIPVSQLTLSPLNVRKTGADHGIEELAASIQAQGIVQNLTVYEEPGKSRQRRAPFPVIAGGRRWRALQRLLKQRVIQPDYKVPCLKVSYERALEISLTENSGREEMHPADQFEAFKALLDAGQSVEDVAARFGVSPLVVQRRLKLANVSPEFIQLYREDKITLEHLMAFALTNDHVKQKQVWESLREFERHPSALRQRLTENEIAVDEPIVKFVGLKAYENAGGLVRRDLFSDDEDGFIMDPTLLDQLAAEKLAKHAGQLREEGEAWVEVVPQLDYSELAAYGRVRRVLREPTKKEQAKLDALAAKRANVGEKMEVLRDDEEQFARLAEQLEDFDAKLAEMNEERMVTDPEQQAVAGVVVSIGYDGKLRLERGLLKPDDAKRLVRERRAGAQLDSPQSPRLHSASLVRRLTAHRTRALQTVIAGQPMIALVALTHRLALSIFYPFGASPLQVTIDETSFHEYAGDLAGSKAEAALEAQRGAWRAKLPSDPESLFAWLLVQSLDDLLALVAICVSASLNGVHTDEGPHPIDALAQVASLDMREWWAPTAEGYLGGLPKARILQIVTEAVSASAAAPLGKLKKGPLATAAEHLLVGTGWLPPILRGNTN